MATTFNRDQFSELTLHNLCADASELGLPPGQFPGSLTFFQHVGNGQEFLGYRVDSQGARVYKQSLGCMFVTIFND